MAIRRYTASADTTITNAFEANLQLRGTGSNMGYADSLEVFSIYGQESGSTTGNSQELTRFLIKFPISTIIADRAASPTRLPASGSVSFYLKMYNAETPFTLPQDFTLDVTAVSESWSEGTGLDMDEYKDKGEANWLKATSTTDWDIIGGTYHTATTDTTYKATFPVGPENIELNVTDLVEQWVDSTYANYGFGIKLTASQEAYYSSSTGENTSVLIQNTAGAVQSYYTKKFFSRSTEFFFKKPVIEARWDSRVSDDRESFYYSSSLAPAADNLNTLYLYNYVRGQLVNIPAVGTNDILVSLYSGSSTTPTGTVLTLYDGNTNITGGHVSAGIYSASVALTAAATPLTKLYDVWHSGSTQYFTSSIIPAKFPTYNNAPTFQFDTTIKNLKSTYSVSDKARFRTFIRNKNWSPNIYTVATAINPTDTITSASYKIYRVVDNLDVVGYGTGSNKSTYLSYDVSGNYFDVDMSLLEKGYKYGIKLSYYNGSIGDWIEQPETFKFRVE